MPWAGLGDMCEAAVMDEASPPTAADSATQHRMEPGEGQLSIFDEDLDASDASDATSLVKPPPYSDADPSDVRRIWLRNFKGFEAFEVELGRFNVLAGANNSGKSTILQAVDLFYSLLKLHSNSDASSLVDGRSVPAGIPERV